MLSVAKDNRRKTRWHPHRSKLNITSDKYDKRQYRENKMAIEGKQDDIHIGDKLNITSDKYDKIGAQ